VSSTFGGLHSTWLSPPAEAGGLFLEFDVPVQEVAPCLVQKIRREVPLRGHQLMHRWLERFPAGFLQPRVLAHIAGAARRRDILPRCHASCGARQDMVEGEIVRAVLDGAILAYEVVAQEDVEPCESKPGRRSHILA
jgi:hypothetical protein